MKPLPSTTPLISFTEHRILVPRPQPSLPSLAVQVSISALQAVEAEEWEGLGAFIT